MTLAPERPAGPASVAGTRGRARPRAGVMEVLALPAWAVVLGGLGASAVVAGIVVELGPLYGAAAAIGVAGLFWLAQRPVLLALLAVILVPVTSGLKRGLPVPGLKVSEVLVVLAALVVLGFGHRRFPGPRWRAWDWAALAYCSGTAVMAFVNVAVHQVPIVGDDVNTMLGPLQFLLLYRVVAHVFATEALRAIALRGLLLASLPVSILALLQMLGPPVFQTFAVSLSGTGIFITPGYDPVMRATSVFPMWHPLGGYVAVIIVVAVALLVQHDRTVLPPWVNLVVVALATGALMLTLTATIIGGALLGVLVVGWALKRLRFMVKWLVIGGTIAVVAFFPQIQERIAEQDISTRATPNASESILPQTVQYRIIVWTEQYAPALSGSWVTGYGPADPPGISWDHTESGYITLILRGGLPYLLVGALVVWFAWRAGRERLAGGVGALSPPEAAIAVTVLATAFMTPFINLFFPYWTASGMPQPMWAVWGLLAAALGRMGDGALPRRERAATAPAGPAGDAVEADPAAAAR
ncbi:MAG: hypothetical protein LCI03_03120 [Actinobacteria bacterium]|nr:hypothetical protein [Actinomycetota bacterium]